MMISALQSTSVSNPTLRTSAVQGSSAFADSGSSREASTATQEKDASGQTLSQEQLALVDDLKQTDAKVRRHEQAHLAASGGLAQGGPSYSLKTGPDGQQYAVGGEVQIDASPGRTPEETIRKARIIRAAALAPSDPSGVDQAVAAKAQAMELQAQQEIALRTPEQGKLANAYAQTDLAASHFSAQA
jgi:hypothetical protein